MALERTNSLVIRTPEGIEFSLALAGPVTRFFAWAIDLAVISVLGSVLSTIIYVLAALSADLAMALLTVAYFVISIGYGILMEWLFRGQTIGKRLMGLRVMDEQGLKLTFSQVVIRNLLRFVDAIPVFYLVGGLSMLFSRRAQRLGDYAANTIVVSARQGFDYDVASLASEKYNSFHDYPHLEARLRQRVSPSELKIAVESLVRREELDPSARVELMRELAAHFRTLADFPEEAVFGLTDENYVRNVVTSVLAFGKPGRSNSVGH